LEECANNGMRKTHFSELLLCCHHCGELDLSYSYGYRAPTHCWVGAFPGTRIMFDPVGCCNMAVATHCH
jgi:hypothetical protein